MSIRLTEKGYRVEVFLGKDPMTNKKIRKVKVFSPANKNTLKEAKLWEAQMLTSYKTGELSLKGSMKLTEYLDYWFETYVEANCKYQTKKRYKTLCDCINDHMGHLALDKLKTPIIDRFYADLKKETKTLKSGMTKRRYMDGTILKTHKLLRQALDKAVGWEIISKNPADYASPPEDDNREIETWTIEEIEKFLNLIKKSKLYLPVFIAYHTGMREAEICALKWSDVNLKEGYLKVNNSMVQEGKELVLDDPKTASSKSIVYLTKELVPELNRAKKEQKILAFGRRDLEFEYVCSWNDARPLRPLYVTQTFTKYVKKFKMKKITFHGLRHSHASILYANGVSSHDISKRLRHSRVATTDDIYIHITDEIKKSTADIFSKAVEKAK